MNKQLETTMTVQNNKKNLQFYLKQKSFQKLGIC